VIHAVAGTNVYISAIVFGGTCETVLALARAGVVDLAISPPVIRELRGVLRETFGWPEGRVREAIADVVGLTSLVRPTVRLSGILPHEPDHRLLECAVAAQATFPVTGKTKHFRNLRTYRGVQIVTTRQFLDLIRPAECATINDSACSVGRL
jgi:predicted nucleic acid-binding protein